MGKEGLQGFLETLCQQVAVQRFRVFCVDRDLRDGHTTLIEGAGDLVDVEVKNIIIRIAVIMMPTLRTHRYRGVALLQLPEKGIERCRIGQTIAEPFGYVAPMDSHHFDGCVTGLDSQLRCIDDSLKHLIPPVSNDELWQYYNKIIKKVNILPPNVSLDHSG